MNRRTHRILEILWLVVAILGLGAAVHKTVTTGLRESAVFYLISFIAAAMFMIRRGMRKRTRS
jgi:hypothetical protein